MVLYIGSKLFSVFFLYFFYYVFGNIKDSCVRFGYKVFNIFVDFFEEVICVIFLCIFLWLSYKVVYIVVLVKIKVFFCCFEV